MDKIYIKDGVFYSDHGYEEWNRRFEQCDCRTFVADNTPDSLYPFSVNARCPKCHTIWNFYTDNRTWGPVGEY